jgi:UDP-N-acetylmuramate dehydrogenase
MLTAGQRRFLETNFPGRVLFDRSLRTYTTFRVGGPAGALVYPKDEVELKRLLDFLRNKNIPSTFLGKGSNTLFLDEGFPGVVISLTRGFGGVSGPRTEGGVFLVTAGAGGSLARLLNHLAGKGFGELSFLAGIPGTVGGALIMNAGAYGKEIGTVTRSIRFMDKEGKARERIGPALKFAYRKLSLPPRAVILSGTFRVEPGDPRIIREEIRGILNKRIQTQPWKEASAGSFFKNPPGCWAGRLIESAGLKGFAVGGAKVSEQHANFLVNTGKATARDILSLMKAVQKKVREKTGVSLKPEVRIIRSGA